MRVTITDLGEVVWNGHLMGQVHYNSTTGLYHAVLVVPGVSRKLYRRTISGLRRAIYEALSKAPMQIAV